MSPMAAVSISIVSHPSGDPAVHASMLDECIGSLRKTVRRHAFRLILTNNLREVNLFDRMRNLTEGDVLVINEAPLGFAANHNRAVARSTEPYVFILNDDTLALEGAVDALVDALEARPELSMVGPKIYRDRELKIQEPSAGLRVMSPERALCWRLLRETPLIGSSLFRPLYDELRPLQVSRDVVHLQGAAFLVRRSTYLKVGGMDEEYGMYREETDLCLRLRAAGFPIRFLAEAAMIHHGGVSTGASVYRDQYLTSLDRFLFKHYGWRASVVTGFVQPRCLRALSLLRRLRRGPRAEAGYQAP